MSHQQQHQHHHHPGPEPHATHTPPSSATPAAIPEYPNPAPAPHPAHTPPASEHPMPSPDTALEKEFELERLILFTDAVFAIAITLLIIDIKWPAARQNNEKLLHHYAPTIFGLVAFATSFLYIGRSWSVHLRLFRLVRKYDQGLINRNLFFLFFIVVFPFANAGLTEHNTESYVLQVIVYLANLGFLGIAHYRLCRYIILEKPSLSVEGRKAEKKFVLIRGRYMMFIACATPLIAAGLWLLFPDHPTNVLYSFAFLFAGLRIAKHRLKALYTADIDKE